MPSISPMRGSGEFSESRSSEAHAIEQASGLPMKVGPCMNSGGEPDEITSATFSVARTAAKLI